MANPQYFPKDDGHPYASWRLKIENGDTGNVLQKLLRKMPRSAEFIYMAVRGVPKKGSKNDTEFRKGKTRTYNPGILDRESVEDIIEDEQDTPILDVLNRSIFGPWGWVSVEWVSMFYIEEFEGI